MDPLEQLRRSIDDIDRKMTALFSERMGIVRQIADYKRERSLPVRDEKREAELIARNAGMISQEELLPYYNAFQRKLMELSREYQHDLADGMSAPNLSELLGYEVILERGCLSKAGQLLSLDRNVFIVTDQGVPEDYAKLLAAQCRRAVVARIPEGEGRKSFEMLQSLLGQMQDFCLTREDCVVAVGGGMVGDLAGFAASIYMRGVDFYNVPTTLLAQVDASVGGKSAVDFSGVKNAVGTIRRPGAVLIDPALLATLPRRQYAAGLAEVAKMALTCDRGLFEMLETGDPFAAPDELIRRALRVKATIVASDEGDHGLRRVLNFGHTIGHAIEATHPELLHGECVALGMLPMCAPPVTERLRKILLRLELPVSCQLDRDRICRLISRDKKSDGSAITVTRVEEPGSFAFRQMTPEALVNSLDIIAEGGMNP